MRPRLLILAGLAAAAAAGAACAEGRFIHPADKNKDDRISKAEWVAYGLPEADFAKTDKDKNGLIDGPEFVAWHTAHGQK